MNVHLYRYFLVGVLIGAMGDFAASQETISEEADSSSTGDRYLDMRQSEDRNIQRFAERYYNLVKLQAWTSENNKSTVHAKYVSHDPDLKSVTLSVVKGSGATRVVREVAVPVDRLNKTCQSRVRQIATLQMRLDELAAEAADNPAGGEAGYGEYGGRGEYGAPMTDEQGEQPVAPSREESADPGRGAYGEEVRTSATGPPMPILDPNDPDPLGFEEAARQMSAGAMPPGVDPYGRSSNYDSYSGRPPGDSNAIGSADRSQ